jgi:LysR family transcriptional regulator, glycine cleavage system transcriptional activator
MPAAIRNLPPLVYLQAFEAAARHRSFTEAAGELGCTQAAISQRVRGLESHLGRKLFERRSNGLDLTEAGEAYLPGIAEALNIAAAATEGLKGRGMRRTVTISAPSSFLNLWLIPRLDRFLAENDEVELRLNSAIWTDPNAELADIVVEVRDGGEVHANLPRIADERLVLVCAPELSACFRQADPARALAGLRRLQVQGRYDLWDRWAGARQIHIDPDAPSLKLDTAVSALEAACMNLGAAIVYSTYCDGFRKDGRLVAPLGEGAATSLRHCIVKAPAGKPRWHPAHRVHDWLAAAFAAGPGE